MSTNTNTTVQNQTSPAPEQTFYSSSAPISTGGYTAGDTFYVTPLGTQADSANATEMWRFDGSKWVRVPIGISAPTGQNVYFNSTDPSGGTIFDVENPPITNNDFLKQDSSNTYYGTDGSVWTWNGTAYITKVYNFTTQKRNEFTATAGQTAFTLTNAPIGQLYGYRNGVKLPTGFTWVGTSVTYVPSNNGGKTIDANDVISFEYSAY